MRLFSLLLLLIVAFVVAAFAFQNNEAISLHFLQWGITTTLAALVGIVYALGMISGWSILGMLRRSMMRVTQRYD